MTTRKQITRSNSDALAAFVQKKAEIDAMLARLQALSDDHFGYSPEKISKSYVSRILRLALLAPDIVEAILAGRADHGMMLERLEQPLPASWVEQRGRLLSARTS